MKQDEKNSFGGLPVAYQSIEFEDKAINELKIISSKKRWQINVRFKSLPSYLRGLTLRYTPNTQLKKFYLKYKYRGKIKIKLQHWDHQNLYLEYLLKFYV